MLDALLPFLLIFTLVYATFQKTKIIGTGEKKYNVIVAFILAFIAVLPHITGTYPAHADIVNIINGALPNISLLIIVLISFLLLIGVFAPASAVGGAMGGFFVLISIIAVIFFFGQAAGIWPSINSPTFSFLNDSDTQAVIIILVVFGFVLWFITRDEGGTNVGGGVSKFLNSLRDSITPK
ncbi:MAG: hypothetical protein V1702_00250 [Candidatus Woesearchaeota archaeon]